MASEKRCHYEVLGLTRDCTPEEIRSAYKKLALQRHPDKLVQSGLSQAEATARFQELAHAYEVLSDPKERAWYDSHRSQILFSDPNPTNSAIPNLFSFFSTTVYSGYSDSGRGFYKVYSDIFDKIYATEIDFARKLGLGLDSVREAPVMGNLDSPYAQVTAFYNYWLGFCTAMDFCWVDQYDVMAGPNRKSRRVMEEENKKLRKKARREYNETVRGLAEFVKKRDKRVIDMAVKRNLEMERKKEEERERKRALERERLEKIKAYVEPEWARVEEELEEDVRGKGGEEREEEEEERTRREGKELYCVVCGKKFKSEKQWKNHEQSKKHKEKVAEFRESLVDEEEGLEESIEEEPEKVEEEKERVVDELGEQISDTLEIGEEVEEEGNGDEFYDAEGGNEVGGGAYGNEKDDDDEMGLLEAMLAGHKSRKNVGSQHEMESSRSEVRVEDEEGEEAGFMEYDNRKSTRRNRGGKKERGKKISGEAMRHVTNDVNTQRKESNGHDDSDMEESSAQCFTENGSDVNQKTSNQPVDKKGLGKKDTTAKSKNSLKQKKTKVFIPHEFLSIYLLLIFSVVCCVIKIN